jgi:hypothetical protein
MEERTMSAERYTQPEWETERTRYYICQNGFGHYWPMMEAKTTYGDQWCQIIIRDSDPFKTLGGAVRFVEKIRARDRKAA